MWRMGKRKKQILTQFAVDMLFLAAGIGIGFLTMLILALLAI